jgi:hypothetical protein
MAAALSLPSAASPLTVPSLSCSASSWLALSLPTRRSLATRPPPCCRSYCVVCSSYRANETAPFWMMLCSAKPKCS